MSECWNCHASSFFLQTFYCEDCNHYFCYHCGGNYDGVIICKNCYSGRLSFYLNNIKKKHEGRCPICSVYDSLYLPEFYIYRKYNYRNGVKNYYGMVLYRTKVRCKSCGNEINPATLDKIRQALQAENDGRYAQAARLYQKLNLYERAERVREIETMKPAKPIQNISEKPIQAIELRSPIKLENFIQENNKKFGSEIEITCLRDVIFPVIGENGLSFCHPQYPIFGGEGHNYRLDFALVSSKSRIAIEVEGYAYHAEGAISRYEFSRQTSRQNFLTAEGWKVVRYSYDSIKNHSQKCQSDLRKLIRRDEELFEKNIELRIPKSPEVSPKDPIEHNPSIKNNNSFPSIRNEHPRAYEPWSEAEDNQLIKLCSEGVPLEDMAKAFGRQESAVQSRMMKFGFSHLKRLKTITVNISSNGSWK